MNTTHCNAFPCENRKPVIRADEPKQSHLPPVTPRALGVTLIGALIVAFARSP
ncbi:MAG: hypothetical protein M3370_02130 [Actinomycetota bacterium]|nr:hypothetical protein [Actinomycetota bacterium]